MVEAASDRLQPSDAYERRRVRASEALHGGRLEEASDLFRRAYEIARESGDRSLTDLAYCNLASVEIRLRRAERMIPRLQEILLRTTDPQIAFLSAYNLALDHDSEQGYRKSLFYARISRRYAGELGDPKQEASSINQIGNVLCATNQFDAALEQFRKAEELLADEECPHTGQVLDNIGYCQVVLGDFRRGFEYLFRSLRLLRRLRARIYEVQPRLTLCFAYLHIARPGRAIHHGLRALEGAQSAGDVNALKYSLLLLGEAYKLAGRSESARECFTLLQETFYPGMSEVPEMLLGVEICRTINLKA